MTDKSSGLLISVKHFGRYSIVVAIPLGRRACLAREGKDRFEDDSSIRFFPEISDGRPIIASTKRLVEGKAAGGPGEESGLFSLVQKVLFAG